MNATVYKRVPGIVTIAEESTSWPQVTGPTSGGGLGFGFKWNMGWMHDTLDYLEREPVHRAYHHGEMTFSLVYAFSENYVLPLSPRRGRARQGLADPEDARRPLAAAGHPARLPRLHVGPPRQAADLHGHRDRPGVRVGRVARARLVAARPPRAPRRAAVVRDLNAAYRASPAFWGRDASPEGFTWIDANDAHRNVFSFVRRAPGSADVVCVSNFASDPARALPPRPARRGRVDARSSTPTPRSTAAPASATSARSPPSPTRRSPTPPAPVAAYAEIVVPPLATVWFRRDG